MTKNEIDTFVIDGNAKGLYRRNAKCLNKKFNIIPLNVVKSVLKESLKVKVSNISPIYDGIGSVTYQIQDQNKKRYIIKIEIFSDHHSLREEFIFNKVIKNKTTLPIADIYVLDYSGEKIKWPFIIYEWKSGKTLLKMIEDGNKINLKEHLIKVGKSLRQIHDVKELLSGYGSLNINTLKYSQKEKIIGKYNNPYEYYIDNAKMDTKLLFDQKIISYGQFRTIVKYIESIEFNNLGTSLLHGDPSLRNFMFFDEKLTAIIDGCGKIGFPIDDLANSYVFLYLLIFKNNDYNIQFLFNNLMEGYKASTSNIPNYECFNFFVIRKLISRIYTSRIAGRLEETIFYKNVLQKYINKIQRCSENYDL